MSECVCFFSSRRRHTRCALVTGVQTCALPILVKDAGTSSGSWLVRLLATYAAFFRASVAVVGSVVDALVEPAWTPSVPSACISSDWLSSFLRAGSDRKVVV